MFLAKYLPAVFEDMTLVKCPCDRKRFKTHPLVFAKVPHYSYGGSHSRNSWRTPQLIVLKKSPIDR